MTPSSPPPLRRATAELAERRSFGIRRTPRRARSSCCASRWRSCPRSPSPSLAAADRSAGGSIFERPKRRSTKRTREPTRAERRTEAWTRRAAAENPTRASTSARLRAARCVGSWRSPPPRAPSPPPLTCELPVSDSGSRVLASPSKHSLLYTCNGHAAIPVVRGASPSASIAFAAPVTAATSDTHRGVTCSYSSRELLLLPSTHRCCSNEVSLKVDDAMARSLDSSIALYDSFMRMHITYVYVQYVCTVHTRMYEYSTYISCTCSKQVYCTIRVQSVPDWTSSRYHYQYTFYSNK